MKLIEFAFLLILMSSCQSHSKNPQLLSSNAIIEIENESVIDSIALQKVILSKYSNARDFKISSDYLSSVSLFWSDPGYVEGPTISVHAKCWIISFSTDSFNDDGSLRYSDDYEYYILIEDNIAFKRNRYHGKGYHGGSFILIKNDMDLRYNDISAPLVMGKDDFTKSIETILKN